MSVEADALAVLKTIFAGLDPSPEPPPVHVWVWPDDWEAIHFKNFPVVLLQQATNRDDVWHQSTMGAAKYQWIAEARIFLATQSKVPDEKEMAQAQIKVPPWKPVIGQALAANPDLSNTVQYMGESGKNLFTCQAYRLGWFNDVFFGLKVDIAITQSLAIT